MPQRDVTGLQGSRIMYFPWSIPTNTDHRYNGTRVVSPVVGGLMELVGVSNTTSPAMGDIIAGVVAGFVGVECPAAMK